jgi:hypothetical protein
MKSFLLVFLVFCEKVKTRQGAGINTILGVFWFDPFGRKNAPWRL